MYINKFKRVEMKYVLNEKEKDKLLLRIKPYLKEDTYYKSTVNNIYFDNENNDLIVTSIEKPMFKEKLRVRSYNTPTMEDSVFLEIKNKYKGVVGKRRIKLTLKELYDFLDNNNYNEDSQIMKEIAYHFNYYKVFPKIFVAYERESFRGIEDNNLRITIDSNLRSRRDNLKLELGSDGTKYFDEPHYIMEIKTLGALPLWFTKILTEEKIYPKSFSKYGNIYKKECGIKC